MYIYIYDIAIVNCELLNDKFLYSDFLTDQRGLFLLINVCIYNYVCVYICIYNIAIINCDLLNDKIPCSDFLTDLTGSFLFIIICIYMNIYMCI
jgi:hypothetical protein